MLGTPDEVLVAITEAAAKATSDLGLSSSTPPTPRRAVIGKEAGGAGGTSGSGERTEPVSPSLSSSSSSSASSSSSSERGNVEENLLDEDVAELQGKVVAHHHHGHGHGHGHHHETPAAAPAPAKGKKGNHKKGSDDSLASSAAATASATAPGSSWLDARYQGVAAGAPPQAPSVEWDALVSARDELRATQAAGLVLHGFKEHAISFPPSCVLQ